MMNIHDSFQRYREAESLVPVWCVTPNEGRIIHRFFDTSPFSPSGRYVALLRLPYEDHEPSPGDKADVVMIDLQKGTETELASTAGWEMQVGANVQWGNTDEELYYNDVDVINWKPYGVKLNPFTGGKKLLCGCIFMVSPDGRLAATTCPMRARLTQAGYGVVLPDEYVPRNKQLAEDDGLFITDTTTGECRLLASLKGIVEKCVPALDPGLYVNGEFYGFQCKWNPQMTRLLIVVRWLSNDGKRRKEHVFTLKKDGSDIRMAITPDLWSKGGHHVLWHPDGENITMNLNIDGDGLRFIKIRYDGSNLHKILDNVFGSGHPSVHPNGRYIITDDYNKPLNNMNKDSTVPIRLIDIESGEEKVLTRIKTRTPYDHIDLGLRLDPHPAWDCEFLKIAFNGYADGTRRVYIADLSEIIGAPDL